MLEKSKVDTLDSRQIRRTGRRQGGNRLVLELQPPPARRAATLGAAALLHAVFLAVLVTQADIVPARPPQSLQTRIIPSTTPPPKPPAVEPRLPLIPMEVPIPDVSVPPPPAQRAAPQAIVRVGPSAPPASHFAPAAGAAGLGLDVATSAGGGARGRGSLAEFEAAVKHAVLARKVQPTLAWYLRNTCVINYTVSVARDGHLAGFTIDPCAIPEINAAAERAIRAAAPFPPPPDLGAPRTDVHGTLIFHP